MRLKHVLYAILISSLLVLDAGNASAGSGGGAYHSIDRSSPQKLVDAMATKAGRGVANLACGWMELPKQIYLTSSEDGAAKGVFIGPLKGVGMAVIRTAAGAAELATFFIAYPGFYDPFFDPAYVWQRE